MAGVYYYIQSEIHSQRLNKPIGIKAKSLKHAIHWGALEVKADVLELRVELDHVVAALPAHTTRTTGAKWPVCTTTSNQKFTVNDYINQSE